MRNARYRVLVVNSHPIQYAAPLFRLMAQHPKLDPLIAYCSLQGAEAGVDPEFGVPVAWDVPLLEGYPWVHVPNRSPLPGLGRFWGLINPGLWKLVRTGGFDAVMTHTGYLYLSYWILLAAAKSTQTPLLFATDVTSLHPRDAKRWKGWIKPLLVPRLFRLPTTITAASQAGLEFLRGLGIPEERLVLTPFVVDNDWWARQLPRVDRAAVRARWGVPESSPVVLFCAKLQPWKRPLDVLRAFARANVADAFLVYAGEGPQRAELEAEAAALGVSGRVRMLGFVNQSQLPGAYRAADLFVLPSEYDQCPVVVCEAMLCGTPVILSDAIRGRLELIDPGKNGFVYRCGDLDALAAILREALPDRERLQEMSAAARRRMETYSPREYIEAIVLAIEGAVESSTRLEVEAVR